MKTRDPWLFETPLAHEMGEYGNAYSSQEYYYNPEFELARELQHELESQYRGGKISITWTPFMSFEEAIKRSKGKQGKGERGIYIINHQGLPSYVGRSFGGAKIRERLQKFKVGVKNARANITDFTVRLGLMTEATQKQIDLVEHLLIRKINARLKSQRKRPLTNATKTEPFKLERGASIANRGATIPPVFARGTILGPGRKELEDEQLFC